MKLKIRENSVSLDDLNSALSQHFSGKYDVIKRNNIMLGIAQSKNIGAVVIPNKKWIAVNGNFPTMERQMIFTVLIVALGIIVPLIVYFAFFHKKMKVVENEVVEFIKMHYKNNIIYT